MQVMCHFTHDEINSELPYAVICEAKEGSRWNTFTRKRRWTEEFSEPERMKAGEIFKKAKIWALVKGAPYEVKMKPETYALWQKLGAFCASL